MIVVVRCGCCLRYWPAVPRGCCRIMRRPGYAAPDDPGTLRHSGVTLAWTALAATAGLSPGTGGSPQLPCRFPPDSVPLRCAGLIHARTQQCRRPGLGSPTR